jgi:hypothetical protein
MDLRDLVDAIARGASSLGQAPLGTPQRAWEETRGWMGRFMIAATDRLLPYYGRGQLCGVKVSKSGVAFPCPGTAVLECCACRQPACIEHCQLDAHGTGTCYHCIAETIQRKRIPLEGAAPGAAPPGHAPPPPPQDIRLEIVRRALAALGLKPGATWDEVNRAHRARAAKVHPDRARTPTQRQKHEDASKRINEALADLKRHYNPGAAA